ncbi:MAG: tRNA (adenosine(37)-N6)-dimethylallyltransferase MiaA [Lentimicrobium sp.]|nr:tRNA (adenosine(37)-N6)-dimethylallyltransferase MiaA [Lentimicrobium sp.]
MKRKLMIVILGPTASGKTRIAALAADKIGGEIISADSRQVYRGLDLGTGKDIDDYLVNGSQVPFHLIDIADAGSRYNIFEYHRDFEKSRALIVRKKKPVVVCGGSGMYLETALGLYTLRESALDQDFRKDAATMSNEELKEMLNSVTRLHNTTDTNDRDRMIRAIEIAKAEKSLKTEADFKNRLHKANQNLIFGISFPREETRRRISQRLEARIENGMLKEVENLLNKGIHPENLIYYGLEYRYITLYITGKISYDEMFSQLNTAIHQFAKRQMTWFRRMEKRGLEIQWINGFDEPEMNAESIEKVWNSQRH